MSWLNNLTDLAGKAESLLNNIDQSAAVAISKATDQVDESPNVKQQSDDTNLSAAANRTSLSPSDAKLQQTVESNRLSRAKIQTKKREAERLKNPKSTDDALFDFLNSDQKVARNAATPTKKTVPSSKDLLQSPDESVEKRKLESKPAPHLPPVPATLEISRSSSFDSDSYKITGRVVTDNGSSSSEHHETISETDVMTLPTDSTASESEFEMVSSTAAPSVSDRDSPSSSEHALPASTSSQDLVVENRLLKNEMASLHQELTQMNERNKKIKSELQSSNYDLRGKVSDLTEELKVKKSQVAALQMRLRESENLLIMEQESSEKLQNSVDKLRTDQSEGSNMHIRAMEELRARLEEAEHHLALEKNAHSDSRREVLESRSRQESETKKIIESFQRSEKDRQQEKSKLGEVSAELRTLKSSLASSKQELADYKQKAARILQSKERLIASLKGSGETDMTSSTIASLELEEIRQERDAVREESSSLRLEMQNLRAEFQDTEHSYQQENSSLQQELYDLRRQLDEETRAHRDVEAELVRVQEDIRRDREEAARSRSAAQSRLKDKDTEIDRLRNSLMIRSQSSPQESELESRLRQLTETVIQKQAVIETMSAEKSSLLVQMERLEGQVKRLSDGGVHVNMDTREPVRTSSNSSSRIPEFRFGGSERGALGKVKRAASYAIRQSIRFGIFVKRYKSTRILMWMYMGLLHLWVMVVLLTYSPELHDPDYVSPKRTDLMVGC